MTKLRYTLCYHWKAILGWLLAAVAFFVWATVGKAAENAPPADLTERIAQIFASIIDENTRNDAFCTSISGRREVRHAYTCPTEQSYIVVDCETEDMVYEGRLDKRSSLDSLQQALFFAWLTVQVKSLLL